VPNSTPAPAPGVRQHRQRAGERGERRQLRHRLVRVHDEADAAEQEQRRARAGGRRALLAGAPVARRHVQQPQRGEHEDAAREARGGVELEEALQHPAEGDAEPVVERRVGEPGERADARHDRVGRQRHLPDDADAERVVRLPGVVPGQPGHDERDREHRDHGGRGRQREPGNPHSPEAYFAGFLV
jgi:hypothetical protein